MRPCRHDFLSLYLQYCVYYLAHRGSAYLKISHLNEKSQEQIWNRQGTATKWQKLHQCPTSSSKSSRPAALESPLTLFLPLWNLISKSCVLPDLSGIWPALPAHTTKPHSEPGNLPAGLCLWAHSPWVSFPQSWRVILLKHQLVQVTRSATPSWMVSGLWSDLQNTLYGHWDPCLKCTSHPWNRSFPHSKSHSLHGSKGASLTPSLVPLPWGGSTPATWPLWSFGMPSTCWFPPWALAHAAGGLPGKVPFPWPGELQTPSHVPFPDLALVFSTAWLPPHFLPVSPTSQNQCCLPFQLLYPLGLLCSRRSRINS